MGGGCVEVFSILNFLSQTHLPVVLNIYHIHEKFVDIMKYF